MFAYGYCHVLGLHIDSVEYSGIQQDRRLKVKSVYIHRVSKKRPTLHLCIRHDFIKYWPIFDILLFSQTPSNFQ